MEARSSFTRSPDAERAEHREHADHERPGVRADLARLELRPDPPDEAREVCAAVDRQAVDQADVDAAPEKTARDAIRRPDERRVVRLVDVVLVRQHPLDPRLLWA